MNIHLITITQTSILIVYRDKLWEFRVFSNGSVYGLNKHYYSAEAAERVGREWVGSGW